MWIATAIHLSACKPSSQGMAGYSRDPRFEQNTARKSGNFWQDTGFDCYPESGIGQNFGHGFGLRLKIIFGISTKEVRDAELSWKRNKESGIRSPSCHATVRLNWSIVYAKTIIFFYNCIKTKTRGKLTLKLSLLVLFRQQELRCYCFLKFEEERLSKKKVVHKKHTVSYQLGISTRDTNPRSWIVTGQLKTRDSTWNWTKNNKERSQSHGNSTSGWQCTRRRG